MGRAGTFHASRKSRESRLPGAWNGFSALCLYSGQAGGLFMFLKSALMNGMGNVILKVMRLATLIWLASAACCMPGMAAEPEQHEQPAAGKALQRQSRNLSIQSVAPVPGLPVPMDLAQADGIRLNALDVTVALKQHQAFLVYTCALDIPRGVKGKTISVGVPFQYAPPDEQANAATPEPLRILPFTKAVQDVVTSVDDLKCDFSLVEGKHLQADAPTMSPVAGITHWLVAQVPNKAGTHVLTFQFSVPYIQDTVITPDPKVTVGEPRLTLLTSPVMTWTGGTPKAVVNVYSSEMTNQSVKLDPSADAKSIVTTPKGVFTWSLLGADGRPYAPSIVLAPGPSWVLDKDGHVTIRGERGKLTDQYDVTASSTLDKDPYGAPCSPDNLKNGTGYWAEGVSGDGQGETLELKLKNPGRLLGIMLETGISPVTNPARDSEARRHPNIAYSMFSRPKGIQVTLNGDYTFDATLRDDWTPQIVVPPYYKQPVRTIKIRIDSSYPGTGTSDTYIGILKPIVK